MERHRQEIQLLQEETRHPSLAPRQEVDNAQTSRPTPASCFAFVQHPGPWVYFGGGSCSLQKRKQPPEIITVSLAGKLSSGATSRPKVSRALISFLGPGLRQAESIPGGLSGAVNPAGRAQGDETSRERGLESPAATQRCHKGCSTQQQRGAQAHA